MKYAVIAYQGHQYKIKEKDLLTVDQIDQKKDDLIDISSVLLLQDGDQTLIGNPFVLGAKVKAKVIEHLQGVKVDVFKYKSKVRYRRHTGFRAQLTKLEIISIKIKSS